MWIFISKCDRIPSVIEEHIKWCDCIYIKVPSSLTNITKIKSKIGTQINVDFIAKEGINNTAKIVYYAINNTVKILP